MTRRPRRIFSYAPLLLLASAAGFAAGTDQKNAASGKKVFERYACYVCHGRDGAGGIRNPNAIGGEVPALTKVAEGYTVKELKEKILKGVAVVNKEDSEGRDPPLFMPAWKEVLSEKEADALVAYLTSLLPESKREEW